MIPHRFGLALLAVLALVLPVRADDNLWTGATNSNWSTVSGQNNWSVSPFYWGNHFVDSAVFNGAAQAPITVTTPITLRGMNFSAGSYTINGSAANPLTLAAGGGGGALQPGEIRVTSPASPTIDAVIGGSVGLKKTGDGFLLLRGANTYTGGTTVSSGLLQFGQGGTAVPLPAGNVSISPGAAMAVFLDTTTDLDLSNDFSNTGLLWFLGTNVSGHSSYRLSGNNSGSSGSLWVGGAAGGETNAARLVASAGSQLGTGDVTVYSGSGIYLPGGTYSNTFTINGNGWSEASGQLGALRLEKNAMITGAVVLQSNARITNFSGTFTIPEGTTISGPISGPFNLEKTGYRSLVLTGNNTYGGTTISAGRLQIGNDGTTGVLPGNTTNHGELWFSRSDTYTYGGVISGTGEVVQRGSGTTILTGANTYTGGTEISSNVFDSGGTLQIGNGGTTGILPGDVVVNQFSSLVFNRSDPVTYAGVISGYGELIQGGAGTLTLSAASTYAGGTTIRSGAITAGVPNALPSATTLTIGQPASASNGRFNTGGLAQTISGLTIYAQATLLNNVIDVGTGTLTLNGNINLLDTTENAGNLFGGTFDAAAGGTLNLGGAVRNITIAGQNNGAFIGDLLINAVVANGGINFTGNPSTFNGAGAHMKLNASVPNTYAGGTQVNAGTLNVAATTTLGTGVLTLNTTGAVPSTVRFNSQQTIGGLQTGTLGAGEATVSLAGTLFIEQSFNSTYAGIITGDGALVKRGAGVLTLTGANTYTGATVVTDNGVLIIGDGGTTGVLPGNIVNEASLVFNRSNDLTYAGLISGSGSLTKNGGGALNVVGGENSFTGGTVVNSGRLLVNNTSGSGTGAGDVTVNAGGTLGGAGSISGKVDVYSDGHIAPGDGIESLDVGSLVLRAGSILDFELGAPGSPGVNSDLINVTAGGHLALSGGSFVFTNAGGLGVGTYTLIDYPNSLGGNVADFGTPIGPAGFSYALFHNAANTSIDLTVSAAGLSGDYNLNGVVDAADYVVWRDNPGGFPAGAYATWRSNFGQTAGSGSGANANAAVPEPGSLAMAAFAIFVVTRRRNSL